MKNLLINTCEFMVLAVSGLAATITFMVFSPLIAVIMWLHVYSSDNPSDTWRQVYNKEERGWELIFIIVLSSCVELLVLVIAIYG